MMILDTNIVSELMRAVPNQTVIKWLDAQVPEQLWLTAITCAEILYGIACLAHGKRKVHLHDMVITLLGEEFFGRILTFDEQAAFHYADLVVSRKQKGRPIGMADAQIAAICKSHHACLVTRNINDFLGLDIDLINPWQIDTTALP